MRSIFLAIKSQVKEVKFPNKWQEMECCMPQSLSHNSIIADQNNVGLNKGTISLLSNWTVTFDCRGRNDGENCEGEKNERRGANHGWVHCPVQLAAASDKADLLHFTAALCLIIWNGKYYNFYSQSENLLGKEGKIEK